MDWSALAELAPTLAAGFTKKPDVVANTIAMTGKGKEVAYQRNLRDFGRELFNSGQIPDAQTVIAVAKKHNVKPPDAMGVINDFMRWRQLRQQMKRDEMDMTQKQQAMDRQAQVDDWRQGYAPDTEGFNLLAWLGRGTQLGQVQPNTMGPLQGNFREGTVFSVDQATGTPHVFQHGSAPKQRAGYQYTPRGILDPNTGQFTQRWQPATDGGKLPYVRDKSKLIDDNNAYWGRIMSQYTDMYGGVMDREKHAEAVEQFKQDANRIMSGQLPSWATGQMNGGGGGITHDYVMGQGFVPANQK